ncbi:MAG: PaaI family thioesterase [Thermoleophilia bacterium]|nr:PaaI family thioesterase [Thermoleophilia bacterium]
MVEGFSERIAFIVGNDRMIPHFHMQVEEARDGFARVSARVEEDFLNCHRVAHGTLIFALIDVAFAIAVNAAADAMGVQWSFNILRAARPGEALTAECWTLHRGSRLHAVEYQVKNDAGKLLAKGQATALPVTTHNPGEPSAPETKDRVSPA